VDGKGVAAAEDAMDEETYRSRLRGQMDMEVGLTVAAHPTADHHRLREVHEVEEDAREVEAAQAEDEGEAAEIACRGLQESLDVGD
jgi:hypothetical protein